MSVLEVVVEVLGAGDDSGESGQGRAKRERRARLPPTPTRLQPLPAQLSHLHALIQDGVPRIPRRLGVRCHGSQHVAHGVAALGVAAPQLPQHAQQLGVWRGEKVCVCGGRALNAVEDVGPSAQSRSSSVEPCIAEPASSKGSR